jgi:uncharacterized protein YuzE
VRKRKPRSPEPIADRWSRVFLDVRYREGCDESAYLNVSRKLGESRQISSREVDPELVLDFNARGELLGIRILSPTKVTIKAVNHIFAKNGLPPVTPIHLKPLHAAAPVKGSYHYLEVTFRKARLWVGYLYLRPRRQKSAHSLRVEPEMVVDISRSGALIGVELLSPEHVTLKGINRVLEKYGVSPLEKLDWRAFR